MVFSEHCSLTKFITLKTGYSQTKLQSLIQNAKKLDQQLSLCIGVVLLPISLLITALIVLCLLKIIKTINSSSLIFTNYRRHRNSTNAHSNLSGKNTVKSTKIPTVKTAENSSSSPSSEKPEKRYSRQDSYFGTYFGMVNGKSILELENPENKV